MMLQQVVATYVNGVFKPDTPLDLDEGAQVVIFVSDERDSEPDSKTLASAAGSWKDSIDCDKLLRDIYASRAEISNREITF